MEQRTITQKISIVTLYTVTIASIGGELVRLPFGPGLGLLPSDLILVIGFSILFGLNGWHFFKTKNKTGTTLLLFLAIALLSWLNGARLLTHTEAKESFLYLGRFGLYTLLFFIAGQIKSTDRNKVKMVCIGAGTTLAVLGFLQLWLFPSFLELEMQKYGWDPHENRLLSTWFDPNFIGGLFAFLAGLDIDMTIKEKVVLKKSAMGISVLVLLTALLLTYSRSAYIAFAVTAGVFGLMHSRKLLITLCIAGLLFTATSERAQERIGGIIQSIRSLTQENSGELPDATARLRIESWKNTWEIFSEHPVLGVGFNAFKFAQLKKGFIQEKNVHSGSGSDASLLTILATTGVIGFGVFCWLLYNLLHNAWRKKNYGLLASLCGLFIHSLFVNSLLLPFIMIYLWINAGLQAEKS